jgi:hypothetical protein
MVTIINSHNLASAGEWTLPAMQPARAYGTAMDVNTCQRAWLAMHPRQLRHLHSQVKEPLHVQHCAVFTMPMAEVPVVSRPTVS